jgi:hypothetical protein
MKGIEMSDFGWLAALPPQSRKSIGFVDHYLGSFTSPRLPNDEFYMRGWNEAKGVGARAKDKLAWF